MTGLQKWDKEGHSEGKEAKVDIFFYISRL